MASIVDISDAEFDKIRDLMFTKTGVFLKPSKKPLVITRLRKRIEELQLPGFTDYIKRLSDLHNGELEFFVNALTTNETYFFRHGKQFDYLRDVILPELIVKRASSREIKAWSAASSTGEEPYTMAMVCNEFFKKHSGWKVSIFASDVNSTVLETAKKGRYYDRSLRETPEEYQKNYFVPVEMAEKKAFFIQKEFSLSSNIKRMVTFMQHNLLNKFSQTGLDVVFLRNVMIYFTRETKEQVVQLIQDVVHPGGYLFISLSESLSDIKSQFKFVQSGVYQKL